MFNLVCKKWNEARELTWGNVKKLNFISEWSKCRNKEKGDKCPCDMSLRDFQQKYSHIPTLFIKCGLYVRYLDLSKFTNSIILTKFKGCFPHLEKLNLSLYKWEDEHIENLFYGMNKLEYLEVQWNRDRRPSSGFMKALETLATSLKSLHITNSLFHKNDNSGQLIRHFPDSWTPVRIFLAD